MEPLRRVVTVLTAPTATFRAVAERPTWVAPLLVLLLLGAAASTLVIFKTDPQAQEELVRERMEERGMSGAELDRAVAQATEITAKIRPILPVLSIGFMVVAYLVVAAVLWGGVRAVGGEGSFVKGLSTTLHGLMPQGVAALLSIPLLLTVESVDPETAESGGILASSLAALAPEDVSPPLRALLGSVDFFSIWSLVLLVLGFHVTARVSKGTSAAVVLGAWVLWVAAKVGFMTLMT